MFAASVNKLCNDFKLAELTADDLKCLIFAQGLVSAEDTEVRRRVLTKLVNELGLTLQKLAEDCQRVLSVKCDSKTIEESGMAQIRKIRNKSTAYSPQEDKRQISCSKPRNKQNPNRLKNCLDHVTIVVNGIGWNSVQWRRKNIAKIAIKMVIT